MRRGSVGWLAGSTWYTVAMITTAPTPTKNQHRADTRQAWTGSASATLPSRERVRIIGDRQQELLKTSIGYVGSETEFRARDSWAKIMEATEPKGAASEGNPSLGRGADLLQHILARPLLTREQEQYLFRQMNYLKFLAEETRSTLSHEKNEIHKVNRIDELLRHSTMIRDRLTEDNLKLVISIGKKFGHNIDTAIGSVGLEGLLDAIDNFDYQRGRKLSTFANRSIKWRYLDELREKRKSSRVLVVDLGAWDQPDTSAVTSELEETRSHQRVHIDRGLKHLNAQERKVLELRFGLDGGEPLTLKEVGASIGRSTPRIQQIQEEAEQKLSLYVSKRDACLEWRIESPIVAKKK